MLQRETTFELSAAYMEIYPHTLYGCKEDISDPLNLHPPERKVPSQNHTNCAVNRRVGDGDKSIRSGIFFFPKTLKEEALFGQCRDFETHRRSGEMHRTEKKYDIAVKLSTPPSHTISTNRKR